MTEQTSTKTTPGLNKEQTKSLEGLPTTSARIRYLDSLEWSRSQIAVKLGKRYQHVRNVLITPVKVPRV